MTQPAQKQRFENIVHLRGVMILLVVLGHAASIFQTRYAGHEMIDSAFGSGLQTVIYSFHMPVYMAISGFLFYFEVLKAMNAGTWDGFGRFVLKKAKRLLVPFIIVMYCWRKPLFTLLDPMAYEGMSAVQILKSYLSFSTTGALWFLYTLFALFVFHRLFVRLIWKSDASVLTWGLAFFAVRAASHFFSGPLHHLMLHNFYFFLGAVIHRYYGSLRKKERALTAGCAVLSLAGTAGLLTLPLSGIAEAVYSAVLAVSDIVLAFLISEKTKHIGEKLIGIFSDLSMGIYLFHEPLMIFLGTKLLPADMNGTALFLSLAAIGLSGSMLMTVLLRKLKLGFVLGES